MQNKQTHIVEINQFHPQIPIIEEAAALLRAGQLVAFPTETVYGLGADATQIPAIELIFAAKSRPLSDPLIVHIADIADLDDLVTSLPEDALRLAQAFWPGPLTLVLPASPRVPRLLTAGLDSVAIRMPRHPVALALIRTVGSPIAAPSANRFMHVSPTTAQHVQADLNGSVPLILDAGPCEVGVESTVLDLCTPKPTILRPGGTSLEEIRTVLPYVQARARGGQQAQEKTGGQVSPGQMLIHYAPAVPTFLFEGEDDALRTMMLAEIARQKAAGKEIGVLIADEDLPTFQPRGVYIYALGSLSDPQRSASRLFAGLRTLEEAGVQIILCRAFAEQGLGMAIHDRLLKAAGGKVITAP